jgi:hypothetical protein
VRRLVLTVACLVSLSAIFLGGAAAVLASGGTSTSAGDQQYVDPLTGTNGSSHPSTSSSSSSSGSGSSSSGTSSPTSNSSLAPSSTSSSSDPGGSSGSGSTASAHSGTLPFTGMNVWAAVAIGLGLFGTGLVLRRSVRAT